MLDIAPAQISNAAALTNLSEALFFSLTLSRQADGKIFVELTATCVDEEGPSLVNEEIVRERVATIDDALALIRANVHIA
ncbi:MAG TPA: hypothetical protein VKT73_04630 [Xanthobacteraceae bacterium]|nr:hypothetical protein [Xanthobacteraceae bacterium]